MKRHIGLVIGCLLVSQLAPGQIYRRVAPTPGQSGSRTYVEPRRYVTVTPTPSSSVRTGPETITRPALIKSSGSYVLGGNIYGAADATTATIIIAAPDVTLDLEGFTVVGRGASAPDAVGVAVLADRVTVRNGSVTNFDAENQCAVMIGAGVRSFVLADLKVGFSDTGILLNPDNNDQAPVVGGSMENCTVNGGSVGILGFASKGVILRNCTVTGAAARRQVPGEGSGILLRGSGYIVESCNMSDNTHGLRLDAAFSQVRNCAMSDNRNTGAYVTGRGNQFLDSTISGNGLIGASVLGPNNTFLRCHFAGNGGHGLSLDRSGTEGASHTYIKDSAASGNSGEQISDKGLGNTRIEGGLTPAAP